MLGWLTRRAVEADRRRTVRNISALVADIEGQRRLEGRKLGQRDVEAIKMVGRRIAQGKL